MEVRFDLTQVAGLAERLSKVGVAIGPRMTVVVTHYAALLDLEMNRAASGRPGPNVITGDFRRSITHEIVESGIRTEAVAGSGAPQAARLEYGFVGTDSLGRHYNQPPYPWARPSGDIVEPQFEEAMVALAVEAMVI